MRIYLDLFWTFFKLGLFTFGGGYAMIPQLKELVVDKKRWSTVDEVMEIIAIAESTPGPIAINMATFIGFRKGKFWGSACATTGVVLPSLIIIYLISLFFNEFLSLEIVSYAFIGIKCAVAFLILRAGIDMFKKMKKNLFSIIIFSLVFLLLIIFELYSVSFSSIIFILIGGILGVFFYGLTQRKKVSN